MIDGVAQNSAYIGDTVKVKIPRTQKMISGLLTEKGIVEVR
jgi:flagella basal body P-ring formation protein FlgA